MAEARLRLERAGPRTVVREAFAQSPLRLLTPKNHGHAAWVYTSTLGGGLVDGDRLALEVRVDEGADGFLSTQGATRVYRGAQGATSSARLSIAEGALLAWLPDPTVCFAGARYRQAIEVELAPSGGLVFTDVLAAGRTARGERWAFDRAALSLRLRLAGQALIAEEWLLDRAHGPLDLRCGRFDAFATLLVAGARAAPVRAAVLAALDPSPPARAATVLEAASMLGEAALVVRLAATAVEPLLARLRALCAPVPALLGDDPWARRA